MRRTYDPAVCRAADDYALLMQQQLSRVRAVLAQARFAKEIDATLLIGTRITDIRTACDEIDRLLEIER